MAAIQPLRDRMEIIKCSQAIQLKKGENCTSAFVSKTIKRTWFNDQGFDYWKKQLEKLLKDILEIWCSRS
jgi:ATP-dependent Lon protease